MQSIDKPERITVAILNYIPFLSGYYAEQLDVLQACIESAHKEPGLPFDLMVFDNGSCSQVQDWLLNKQRCGEIQYLLLSQKNLGKGGAWNQIFGGAPGEIIVYSDCDVLFSPGWLKRSIEILETFPKAGMVTARPFRTREHLFSNTIEWAKNDPEAQLQEGQFITWQTFLEFNLSLGVSEEEIRKVYEDSTDIRITYKGLTAQVGASHWQFAVRKDIISQFLPFQMDRPMGQVLKLDEAMNDAGYLRLMVPEPLAMNMSNTLPEELRKKPTRIRKTNSGPIKKILELHLVKGALMKIYNQIFRWYNN